MNAAGLSPLQLLRPFLYATVLVALLVAFIAAYLAPASMRRARGWDAEITADVLTNVLQPGRFVQVEQDLTIRIRERQPGGLLAGIFVDDRRDPKERDTIVADHGTVLKNEQGSFLILQDGHLERLEPGREPAMIGFSQYAFDMSKFADRNKNVTLGTHERYIWELLTPPANVAPGPFRAEFHDRLTAPVYALAFAILTFAFLGSPRTTRQSRNFSIWCAILAVFGLRVAGFACSVLSSTSDLAAPAQYLLLAGAIGVSLWIIGTGIAIEPPAALMEAINRSNARMGRLLMRRPTPGSG